MKSSSKKPTPDVDALWLAQRCRALSAQRFTNVSSCIETSQLFERVAFHLGLPVSRVVCQVEAFSPKLAELVLARNVDRALIGQPGYWSVGVGIPHKAGDFVGLVDEKANRFVGHVVCLAEGYLLDPTADQMSRPQWDMPVPGALMCKVSTTMPGDTPGTTHPVAVTRTSHGVLVKYILHPDVAVPRAKASKVVERMAIGLANAIQNGG